MDRKKVYVLDNARLKSKKTLVQDKCVYMWGERIKNVHEQDVGFCKFLAQNARNKLPIQYVDDEGCVDIMCKLF